MTENTVEKNNLIRLAGIVERITYHNAENGWSVLKVSPFNDPRKLTTVLIHQAKVFAGSSMEFWGTWSCHPKHGEQFRAAKAFEKKPASSAAMEKYLGSGLIKGVGPKTAAKIVKFFKEDTLRVFEETIDDLMKVPGIAEKKLSDIKNSWQEHKAIRDVMLFLQGYGISTLFAVKIFKTYGDNAISIVSQNPYQLAKDIYGIGFFSADRIALNMGFEKDGDPRIEAGIKHVLAASRDEGHCYLYEEQIVKNTRELLQIEDSGRIRLLLNELIRKKEIQKRTIKSEDKEIRDAFYTNTLFFDESYTATKIKQMISQKLVIDQERVQNWIRKYCEKYGISLSGEQQAAVAGISQKSFSILTGGPGCGKTTATRVLVKLLLAMQKKVILAAPTGRAAQRMSEVIGSEARTIHRLLEWSPDKNRFKRSEENPLPVDFLIVDECSMLDISLAAALLRAVPMTAQVLFIGDPDQLPSVGAGNVLHDLLKVPSIPCFLLTKIFRQAEESMIIRFAHQINRGEIPRIASPVHRSALWQERSDCLFVDAEEATKEQIQFLQKAKSVLSRTVSYGEEHLLQKEEKIVGVMKKADDGVRIDDLCVQEFGAPYEVHAPLFVIPDKFTHVDLEKLSRAENDLEEIKTIIKSVHPWSALHYGMTGLDVVLRLYTKTIPEYFGKDIEIQVLTPQVRGSLGTMNLNRELQNAMNPEKEGKRQITIGERVFREGDRVIQTRNNYDLGVFNGDIGKIVEVDLDAFRYYIHFGKEKPVLYQKEDLTEIVLAYAITIHKSQGSEFDAVIIPVATQHFKMLFRNVIYTGLTRAKKLCVFVGTRKALSMAVRQIDNRKRQTALTGLILEQGV
ncbi:MAG: SF1B family DNA helicase RecD2 [Candidatus Loosdrechtia sp.]|uniref:SF1B family DNA helicase RecD2 n=1 Tax=Candidatus Loosdrechtia sp. TaxID=3101272 RepID=UPI003A790C66|nr:MAG: AAA family ATPase [Candidatus Jettenia sp. AMX2]